MIVLDHTAVLALCRGHRLPSAIAVVEVDDPSRRAHVPALCLVAAGMELAGTAAHVGALPGLEFLPLDFAGAAAAGAVEGQVLTATPEAYDGTGVWAVDIGKA
ncbi:hypothetical protein [Streptomyces sp. NBC_00096]|uniref:hypothetical protein n=1 Tax=Streptomyces sp. NBC_00096 TaxID=2975650 RepID=UPI0032524D25